jgi:hypothetical protein
MARLAVAGNADLASPRQTQPHLEAETVVGTLLLLVVGGAILYPLALIFIQSFDVPIAPGQTQFGLDGWQAVFTERSLHFFGAEVDFQDVVWARVPQADLTWAFAFDEHRFRIAQPIAHMSALAQRSLGEGHARSIVGGLESARTRRDVVLSHQVPTND